ncbi:MAG TPA: hypothetical protein VFZ66_18010 [Herpetosiphonaceae bacterium]
MSDQPLFQNTDEQEAVYAPQQLPPEHAGKQAADTEEGRQDTAVSGDDVGVPAAGAGILGQTGGGVSTGVVGGSPSALGPAIGAGAPEDETTGDRPV